MIRNYTPHQIVVCGKDGTILRSIPSDGIARISQTTSIVGVSDGIPLSESLFGDVTGLPSTVEGTLIIVSQMVMTALPGRKDLCVPTEMVRDGNGQIIGCMSLGIHR